MAELLKNYFNKDLINKLAVEIYSLHNKFNKTKFVKNIFNNDWENFELKERMRHIVICLHNGLNLNYKDEIRILKIAAPKFKDFTAMIFPDFVEVYGLDNYEISIPALEFFTQHSSSEFAIRRFIIKYPDEAMKQMLKWSKHKNFHVRRLATEGSRPRLPWSIALPKFKKNPTLILPILENLKNDESEYVRKSVANNLNDISKDNPEIVLGIVQKWIDKTKNTDWILKHGCRTLLKKGDEKALSLFGIKNNLNVKVLNFRIEKQKIKIGDSNYFSFNIKLDEKEDCIIRIEYFIYFIKSNGKLAKKIFKIGESKFANGTTKSIRKKHNFEDLTTRKHYSGVHKIALVVNGKEIAECEFELVV
ncbi:MAG: DNA alkylation repair protein [Ignavibacteriae bacterium]|nr:DNA alkylation repair protein [Ignavibacteriota bacterium]